jgi:hypothetical protein
VPRKKLENQIKNSHITALDVSIAAARNDQRAWVAEFNIVINAPEVGKYIEGNVTWRNSGKTFARRVTPNCNFIFLQKPQRPSSSFTRSQYTRLGPYAYGARRLGLSDLCSSENLQVHHQQFRSKFGNDELNNLISLCAPSSATWTPATAGVSHLCTRQRDGAREPRRPGFRRRQTRCSFPLLQT